MTARRRTINLITLLTPVSSSRHFSNSNVYTELPVRDHHQSSRISGSRLYLALFPIIYFPWIFSFFLECLHHIINTKIDKFIGAFFFGILGLSVSFKFFVYLPKADTYSFKNVFRFREVLLILTKSGK